MGTENSKKSDNSQLINKDASKKKFINVYVCGNINAFLNCDKEIGYNYIASRNYHILEQVFPITDKVDRVIQSKNNKDIYYQYEFRKKEISEKNKKFYNAFLFLNKADQDFLDNLFDYLFEQDPKNANKNVILYFGEDDSIKKSFDKLYEKSAETAPLLIIVNNSKHDDKLHYTNYLPDLNTIENFIKKENKTIPENEMSTLSEKALISLINTKLFRTYLYYNQLGYNLNMINPMNETNLKVKTNVTIAVLGYSGCGKSTFINLIYNELVARVSSSSTDVTTECSEYYSPISDTKNENVGQIKYIDFPGITKDENYKKKVEPKIDQILEEYSKNMEQIDIALFFITNGNQRELTDSGLKLINLLHKKKIKIIFVINGELKPFQLKSKKQALINGINNKQILNGDCNNLINTDFYQLFKEKRKKGIDEIFKKIIEIIEIKDKNFNVEDITIDNYNEKLLELSKSNRVFELFDNMNAIKETSKIKANLAVTGYSLLSCGSSAISIFVPVIDCALAIGYQVAMVYSIFSIYELRTQDYNIVKIILTGGNCIEEKINNKKINNKSDEKGKDKDKSNDIAKGNMKEAFKDVSNTAIFAAQVGIKAKGVKEAGKVIVEKTVETVATDTISAIGIKASFYSIEGVAVNGVGSTVTTTVEKLAIQSSKELAETGLKEGSKKIIVEATKEAMLSTSIEGGELIAVAGTKESVKTITETIVVQQGGKAWLVNLGKCVPFIGAGISAITNTYSTAKLGIKLVDKLDREFDDNQQRKVDLLKGRIYGLFNIIEQMNNIIESLNSKTTP